jgi:hypothetical protein
VCPITALTLGCILAADMNGSTADKIVVAGKDNS